MHPSSLGFVSDSELHRQVENRQTCGNCLRFRGEKAREEKRFNPSLLCSCSNYSSCPRRRSSWFTAGWSPLRSVEAANGRIPFPCCFISAVVPVELLAIVSPAGDVGVLQLDTPMHQSQRWILHEPDCDESYCHDYKEQAAVSLL